MNRCRKQAKLRVSASKASWVGILAYFLLATFACSRPPQPRTDIGRVNGLADSLRAAYLAEILTILRQAPHPLEPGEAERLRQRLQRALDTYFPPAPSLDRSSLHAGTDQQAFSQPFPGHVLDMARVSDRGPVVVLERDSIAVVRLSESGWRREAWPLTGVRRRPQRPMWPAGRIGIADLDADGTPEIFARHSDFAGLFLWRWHPQRQAVEPARLLQLRSHGDLLQKWDAGDYVPGRPFLALPRGPVRYAHDVLLLNGRWVILDTAGGLWLVDSTGALLDHFVGRFGTRLAPVSDNRFLVLHPVQSTLLLFSRQDDTLQPVAGLPLGNERPCAAAATQMREALWLALQTTVDHYQLQRLAVDHLRQPFPDSLGGLPRFGGKLEIILPGDTDLTDPLILWQPGFEPFRRIFYPTLAQQGRVVVKRAAANSGSTVVEVVLHPGVRFSDGTPLSAPVVKSGWKRLARSAAGARDLWWWRRIAGAADFIAGRAAELIGIEVVDSLTLRLHGLPRQEAEELLGRPSLATTKPDPNGGWPIGVGAFQPVDATPDRLIAIANPYHPPGRVILDTLIITAARDASILDLLNDHPRAAVKVEDRRLIEMLRSSGSRSLRTFGRRRYVAVVGSELPPLDRPEVRAAILGTIEPHILSELVLTSYARPISSLFGVELPGPPAADSVRTEARPIPVEYRAGDRTAREIAERLAARLAALGFSTVGVAPRTGSADPSTDRPIGILIDDVHQDSGAVAGRLDEFLRRYGAEFDREIDRLERSVRGGTDAQAVARQVLLDLAKEGRIRGIVEVQSFLALPRGLVATALPPPDERPDLATAHWRLSTLPVLRSP